ncbi:MAG: pilus assembly PilX N-terminal domain-containing protein [Haloechinothrix sp.]
MMMQRLSDQRGVAAITILMVTVVLALAGSVVAFTATAELEIGGRERRAEEAFVGAEAGLDVASTYFDSVDATIGQLGTAPAFCLNNPVVDDAVEYRHPDPAMNNAICGIEITSPQNGDWFKPPNGKPFIDYKVLSRSQEGRTVTRALSSTYRVVAWEVPFGMFINGNVDFNGAPQLLRESLLVNGVVTSREKLDTDWDEDGLFDDPDLGWEFHKDRITSDPDPDMCLDGSTGQMVGCAAVFSNFQIYEKNQQKTSDEIHSSSPSPYPHDRDSHQQKIVNGVAQPVVTLPDSDVLEAMPHLKQVAQAQGNYFDVKDGSGKTELFQPGDVGAPAKEFAENVVVYIDADADDTVKWKVDLIPGSTSSDMLHTYPDGVRAGPASGILVVRGGDLQLENGGYWSGAIFVPEGEFRILGSVTCVCTIYAKGFSAQGGGSTIELTPEWFQNLHPGLVNVSRRSFSECEPFQASQLC